jgi:hypothetical protein
MLWCNIVLVLYRILTICWLNLNRWTMCTPVEKLREAKGVPHARTLLPSHAVVWRVCVCMTCTSGTTPRHDEVLLWLLSMCIYIDTSLEPRASYGHHTFSSLLSCSEFSPLVSSIHRRLEKQDSRNHAPRVLDTGCVRRSSFFGRRVGVLTQLLASTTSRHFPAIGDQNFCGVFLPTQVFFLMAVRGTALTTSSNIDCGPWLRATHYVD